MVGDGVVHTMHFALSSEVREAGEIEEVKKAYERNRDKQAFIRSLLGT